MRFNLRPALAGACCFIVLTIGSAAASAQTDNASASDKKFVKTALQGGMAEVDLGQLASQKGNSDVKQFGEKMVQDHTKLGDQMKGVAQQVGVTPPTMVTPADKALKTKLEALSGDSFDKAYIKAMVKDHEKDLSEFQKESTIGSSMAVKDAAQQGSQVIQQHLDLIKQIAQKHGVSAGSAMASARQ
jgi:putative membrane protein